MGGWFVTEVREDTDHLQQCDGCFGQSFGGGRVAKIVGKGAALTVARAAEAQSDSGQIDIGAHSSELLSHGGCSAV